MPAKASVYWPSCKLRFFLIFEDFLPESPRVRATPPNPLTGPEIFAAQSIDLVTHDIIPYDVSYELNSYREADTARFTIPAASLPIDPRIIRAGQVQVFAGTVTPTEFADAVGPTGGPVPAVADFDADGQPTEVFRGVLDDLELTIDGNDTLSGSARDITSVLIDAEISANVQNNLPADVPLDQALTTFLIGDGLPAGKSLIPGLPHAAGIQVVNDTLAPLPTLREIASGSSFDSNKRVKRNRPGRGSKSKISYWDMITDLVVGAGFIVFVRLGPPLPSAQALALSGAPLLPTSRPPQIVISDPRTFYGSTEGVRKFFFGGNTDSLVIRRSLTGLDPTPNIEVAARSDSLGATVKAQFPPIPKKNRASQAGDRIELRRFNVGRHGFDPAKPRYTGVLLATAQSIFEQLGRGEMSIRIATQALSILGFNSEDPNLKPDILQLKPGDPVIIGVQASDPNIGRISQSMAFESLPRADKVRVLISNLHVPEEFASSLVVALEDDRFPSLFRCKDVTVHWNFDEGFEIETEAINFLDVRQAFLSVADQAAKAVADAENEAIAIQQLKKQLEQAGG